MPTAGKDEQYLGMCKELEELIFSESDDAIIIGSGDLNIRADKHEKRNDMWNNLMKKTNLSLWTPNSNTHVSHSSKTSTTLDYFFTSRHVRVNEITVLDNTLFPQNLSSHYPIILNMEIDILSECKEEHKKSRKKMKNQSLIISKK